MKKLKKLVSMLAAVAICVLLPGINTLTVAAEEPVTYYVKYLEDSAQWRYQAAVSKWDTNKEHRELYYMMEAIKDGDIVIVDGANPGFVLDLSVRLSNLTILHGAAAVVYAKSIDECFVCRDSVSAINGDITNAYVYENARCTFNNNIGTLQILDTSGLHATVTVNGTVGHLIGQSDTTTYYNYYSFPAGKLLIENGTVKTEESLFSKTAPAADTTQATTQETTSQTTPTQASSDEYDDVPKTGESNIILWLLGIAAFCFAGRYALKKA